MTRQQAVGVEAWPPSGDTARTGVAGLTGRVGLFPPEGRIQYVWSEAVCVASSLPACRGRGRGSSDTPGAETGGGDGGFSEVLLTSSENDRRGGTRWTFFPALGDGVFLLE